jgi:hypothetical protein
VCWARLISPLAGWALRHTVVAMDDTAAEPTPLTLDELVGLLTHELDTLDHGPRTVTVEELPAWEVRWATADDTPHPVHAVTLQVRSATPTGALEAAASAASAWLDARSSFTCTVSPAAPAA